MKERLFRLLPDIGIDPYEAEITETAENKFHVEHEVYNPYEGYSFDIEIRDTTAVITNSVYGDNGEFEI